MNQPVFLHRARKSNGVVSNQNRVGDGNQGDRRRQDVSHPRAVRHCVSYEREYRSPWKLKVYA